MKQRLTLILTILCATALLATPARATLDSPIVGASATIFVPDFPEYGHNATAEWDEDAQAFTVMPAHTERMMTMRPETATRVARQIPKKRLAFPPRILSTDSGGSEDKVSRALRTGSTKPSAWG